MSEHKNHHRPPESKASLNRQFYKDDVRRWMYSHATVNSKRAMKQHTHRTYYQSLLRSLRNEEDPVGSAMKLIGPHHRLDSGAPDGNDEESLAGEIVKQELEQEIQSSPSKKLLSAGVVLTERRRKMILDRLQNGGFEDDDTTLTDSNVSLSTDSFGTSSQSRFEVAITTSNQEPFRPKWDHYDTMRSRWRFIRPQTQLLLSEEQIIAPKTKTHVMRSAVGEKIQGNYVEVMDFNAKRTSNNKMFQTTGALQLPPKARRK